VIQNRPLTLLNGRYIHEDMCVKALGGMLVSLDSIVIQFAAKH
jgi:hypothetical protein